MNESPYPPWLSSTMRQLQQQYQDNQLPHAILIHGLSGIGKHLVSEYLAQLVLCQSALTTGTPCQQCQSCQLIQHQAHPDYLKIAKDEQGHIKIETLRALIQQLTQTSNQLGYTVVTINSSETMTEAAAHALLKTLEDPLGKTLFILTTDQLQRLIPTVRSRCQILSIPTPSAQVGCSWLIQKAKTHSPPIHLNEKTAYYYLSLNDGIPAKAWDHYRQISSASKNAPQNQSLHAYLIKTLMQILTDRHNHNPTTPMIPLSEIAEHCLKKTDHALNPILNILLQLINWLTKKQLGLRSPLDYLEDGSKTIKSLSLPGLHLCFKKILKLKQQLRLSPPPALNPSLQIEALLLFWIYKAKLSEKPPKSPPFATTQK